MLGWSQQQLADKAIVSLNAVTRLEKGKVDLRLSTITSIVKARRVASIFAHYPWEIMRIIPAAPFGS